MDRRLTPFSGHKAHISLLGKIEAQAFTEGHPARMIAGVTDLLKAPGGARDRQVLYGERVTVIDHLGAEAFVMADKDGFCGWVPLAALGRDHAVTHRIKAPFSQLYEGPKAQARDLQILPFAGLVEVLEVEGTFARTPRGWVPVHHLEPVETLASDPVAVAAGFLGTPYLWGGNSRAGIDCSGLAQAAMLACGTPCPGDSDLQAQAGIEVAVQDLCAGDLVFWKGHVAVVSGPDEIIHATGAFMGCVRESLSGAEARILAAGSGPITHRRRLSNR